MALRALQGPAGGVAPVGGTGTTNTIPRWTGPSTLGDSIITQNTAANAVGVGATVNSTWAAGWRAVQIGQNAAIWAETSAIDGRFSQNVVWTGSAFNYLVNGAALMYAQNANGHTWSYAGAGTAGNPITFTTGMVLNSSGNVGIGTASPYTRTESSTARTTALTSIAAFASMPLTVTDTTAFAPGVGGGINFRGQLTSSSYTNFAAIWAAREVATNSDYRGSLILATADNAGGYPVERARIDSAGNLILNTANTGATIQAAGSQQGLKLPATPGNTDPNTLDCYADGGTANSGGVTWTPTLKFGGNTTGITYNTQMGRYTRIGNMVFATCYVRLTNKGSATGAATIDGLPTSANLAGLYAAGTIGFISAITSTGTMEAYITPNSSQITLRQVDIAGTNAATTDVNFANTSEIVISIAYSVN